MMQLVVVLPRPDAIRRQWFSDARDDGRHMEVTWHPDEALVIVSLWHGSMCRATFRMPVEDAAVLVESLAQTLGDAGRPTDSSGYAGDRLSWLERGRRRIQGHAAEASRLAPSETFGTSGARLNRRGRDDGRTRRLESGHGSPSS